MTETTRAGAARARLLDAALSRAPFEGWNRAMLAAAAKDCGLTKGELELYLPGGAVELIGFWSAQADAQAAEIIAKADLKAMKIRERVGFCVLARLQTAAGHEEAASRARARLLLPDAAGEGLRLAWNVADMIWRAIGDTSTDGNYYSKRAILSGVWLSTLAVWLDEADADKPLTKAFLDRRIANVMEFEKLKAQARKLTDGLPDPAGVLARLRYGWGPRV
ncbi:MAG: COQ9 family protein [Maricaulaceae bacterium]|nr:COQ9 family protein [Maricaulaceae bacterium]